MKKHTKCRMNEICKKPHRDGECERNCYYNTIEVKTNADRIHAMTDEELAEWLDCVDYGFISHRKDGWLDWLKQEVEE